MSTYSEMTFLMNRVDSNILLLTSVALLMEVFRLRFSYEPVHGNCKPSRRRQSLVAKKTAVLFR